MNSRSRIVVLALFVSVLGLCFSLKFAANRPAALSTSAKLPVAVNPPARVPLPAAARVQVAAAYGRLPIYFIANRGQINKRVQYYVKSRGQSTYFTRKQIVLTLRQPEKAVAAKHPIHPGPATRFRQPDTRHRKFSVVRIQPLGLKPGVKLAALEPANYRVNYFIGHNPKNWHTDIPTYRAVAYENAYAGIDLKFHGTGRRLEYDIVVRPGADPGQVRFAYLGVKKLEVTPAGDLALMLPDGGQLLQQKPLVYQEVAGQRVPLAGRFRLCRQGARLTCGFAVAAYDRHLPLVIDPVLAYSTYLGGKDYDEGHAIAVDASGAAYITGATASSTDFPIHQAYQGTYGGGNYDAFVTKLNPSGTALVYSTYLGGSNYDNGFGIAVDAGGAAYVTGATGSTNFPTYHAYQGTLHGAYNAFITKLSPAGNALVYSTYLGGSSADDGYGIAVDSTGAAYVTGVTESTNFPTYKAYQGTFGGGYFDAFVSKLSPVGNVLVYSTFLGGSSADFGGGIAVDASGAAYVTGYTQSFADFPIHQAIQPTYGGGSYDAFVTKLSPAGNALVYSTYLGGGSNDYGGSIAVDAGGAAYVIGYTNSTDFPIHQAIQPTYGGGNHDGFITKLNSAGNALAYSTFLGGSSDDYGNVIAADAGGAAYVIGYTNSTDFPIHQAFQGTLGGDYDAFVAKLRQPHLPPLLLLLQD